MLSPEEQNKQRDIIQSRAVISAAKVNHLVLEWSTGCGKTLAAIKVIAEIVKKNPMAQGYIICKESTHKKNWVEDFKKHGYEYLLDNNVEILLYASVKKCFKREFFVLDEVHALTPARATTIRRLVDRDTKVLYLSATIPEVKMKLIEKVARRTQKYYRIPLVMAIKLGLLPEPEIIIHRAKLKNGDVRTHKFLITKGDKTKRKKITCLFHERWKHLKAEKHLELSVKCNEQEYYDLITDQMEYYKGMSRDLSVPQHIRTPCGHKFLNLGSKRKNFIALTKTSRARSLVKQFRKDEARFVCFTGSISQAERLSKGNSIHSKNIKGKNQELIDCFNRKECNELFAVKMLREGINLTDIEKGIIVQLDSTMGSFYQMLGRCLRYKFPEMHLLILEDTQDEVYFATSMKDFDIKYIVNG